MSVVQCLPSCQVPFALPKPKPVCLLQTIPHVSCGMDLEIYTFFVPSGNNSKSFHLPEIIHLTHGGIKSTSPMHGDGISTEAAHKQSHMFCPDTSICCCASSSQSSSLITDITAQHGQDVVSTSNKMSSEYSLVPDGVISHQYCQTDVECSSECSEGPMNLALRFIKVRGSEGRGQGGGFICSKSQRIRMETLH